MDKFVVNFVMDDGWAYTSPWDFMNLLVNRLVGDGLMKVTVVGLDELDEETVQFDWVRT